MPRALAVLVLHGKIIADAPYLSELGGRVAHTLGDVIVGGMVIALTLPGAAHADDTQSWVGVVATGPVNGQLGLWTEAQLRITDDVSRLGVRNLRIGAGWEPSRDLSLYGGYALFRGTPASGADFTESRLWQQALYTVATIGRTRVTARTRLEQRRREGVATTSWRARQWVRVGVPLGKPGTPSFVATTELFAELAGTRWATRPGLDQLRTFVSVGVPVLPRANLEVGYMNQRSLARRFAPNHIASATLFVRFK